MRDLESAARRFIKANIKPAPPARDNFFNPKKKLDPSQVRDLRNIYVPPPAMSKLPQIDQILGSERQMLNRPVNTRDFGPDGVTAKNPWVSEFYAKIMPYFDKQDSYATKPKDFDALLSAAIRAMSEKRSQTLNTPAARNLYGDRGL